MLRLPELIRNPPEQVKCKCKLGLPEMIPLLVENVFSECVTTVNSEVLTLPLIKGCVSIFLTVFVKIKKLCRLIERGNVIGI